MVRPERLCVPIVPPIRELDSITLERRFSSVCFVSVSGTDGFLLASRDGRLAVESSSGRFKAEGRWPVVSLMFGPDLAAEGLFELTAGCLAPSGAAELRVPIERPMRERRLFVGSLFAFERDGVL